MLITLDFETYYDSEFSLSKLTTEEYIRDRRFEVIGFAIKVNDGPTEWVSADLLTMTSHLQQRFDWANAVLLAQNTNFDGAILHWIFGIKPKRYADTMAMARGLVGLDTSCSLKALGEYFKLPTAKGDEVVKALGKRRSDFNAWELHQYGEYCKNDVEMTYDLFNRLAPCTLPEEMKLQDWTIRCFTEPKLLVDGNVVQQELVAYNQRKNSLLQACGIADVGVLRSDATFAEHLERLGVQPPMKPSPKQKNPDGTRKEVYAFSKQDLEFMELLEDEDEKVVALVEARLGTKSSIIESRLQRFLSISRRGPLPVPLMYAGATPTRRWSGTDQINLQNLPRNKLARNPDGSTQVDANGDPVILYSPLRRAICAPPGMRMASADLSQIELRVNAWQSGQTDVLDLLRNGGDVYSDQATALYGYEVTKATGKTIHALERFVGKTTELQCGYQCGWAKFLHSLKIAAKRDNMVLPDTSPEFAQRTVDGYRSKRHRIAKFWYTAQDALQSVAYGLSQELGPYRISDYRVWLPNGSYLYYPDLRFTLKEGEGEQGCEWTYRRKRSKGYSREKMYGGKFVENITQAVARLFVSDALLRLETVKYADGSPVFHVVFSVHDELVVLFDERLDEKWVKDTLKWAMTTNPTWALDLPLACDVGIGANYAECK